MRFGSLGAGASRALREGAAAGARDMLAWMLLVDCPSRPGDPVNDRTMIRPLPCLLFLLFAALSSAPVPAPAAAPKTAPPPMDLPIFKPDTSTIEADDRLKWPIRFSIQNRFPVGMYLDSLFSEVQDLDPGETRAERVTRYDISRLVAGNAASAGDTYGFSYVAPAIAERARLTFRLVISRADKTRNSLTTVVEAMPGPVSRDHPSQFLNVDGRKVEYVLFRAPADTAPALLFVHPFGGNARTMMTTGMRLAGHGYTMMLVSMPGYGQSEGAPDYCGPATLKALGAALDRLEATPGVDPKRVGVWGRSRGAMAATMLGAKRAEVRAVVAEAGTYDMWSIYRAGQAARREAIVREAGSDSSAWRDRSAALQTATPRALLILHGEKDDLAPASQAHGYVDALKARGAVVESRFFPSSGHELPVGEVLRTALEFLERMEH